MEVLTDLLKLNLICAMHFKDQKKKLFKEQARNIFLSQSTEQVVFQFLYKQICIALGSTERLKN